MAPKPVGEKTIFKSTLDGTASIGNSAEGFGSLHAKLQYRALQVIHIESGLMSILKRSLSLASAGLAACSPAFAEVCDYKPSKLVGEAVSTAAAAAGGGAAAAGVGLQTAGYYTLVHSTSGLMMLGSTAAGASAAGTTGIIAGSAGAGATIASIVMAPVTITVGAITVVVIGGFEGACYFQIERIDDPYQVRGIVESIAANDPKVSVVETADGPSMVIRSEEQAEKEGEDATSYMIRNLYIADGDLMHRDWGRNTNLGPVAYVLPEADE